MANSDSDRAFQDLVLMAEAAYRVERLLNPGRIPWDTGGPQTPAPGRQLFGNPAAVVVYFSRIRDTLDEVYTQFGWQKFCSLPGEFDFILEVKPSVTGLRDGLAEELEQSALDLKRQAASPDYPDQFTTVKLKVEGRAKRKSRMVTCKQESIPAELVDKVSYFTSELATRIRRWAGPEKKTKKRVPIMAEPLTKSELAVLFCCSRNRVNDLVLAKYPHQKDGTKFRLQLADMPPTYHEKHRTR